MQILEFGHAYLAPGNMHLTIEKVGNELRTKLLDTKKVTNVPLPSDAVFGVVPSEAVGELGVNVKIGVVFAGIIYLFKISIHEYIRCCFIWLCRQSIN